jgi:hypothetical protein
MMYEHYENQPQLSGVLPGRSGADSIGVIAFAGLAIALGANPDEVEDIFDHLGSLKLPKSPSEAIEQMQEAIIEVRMAD